MTQDYFKEEFKYYKRKIPPPSFDKVIDFETETSRYTVVNINENLTTSDKQESCYLCKQVGLKDHGSWKLFSLKEYEGFLCLKNPFTVAGQQMWIRKCLELYPRKPSVTNLDAHYSNMDDIWSLSHNKSGKNYLNELCWSTLGYHHNWDTKVYDPNHKSDMPACLCQLSKHIADCLGFTSFEPEAAIVNYYKIKSSLGIHNDNSEENLDSPIISFSFGQTGIFLLGSHDKSDRPVPMFLRSGDVVIMSGASRLAYHAVPCILMEYIQHCYYTSDNEEWLPFKEYVDKSRINISVRQVYNSKTEKS